MSGETQKDVSAWTVDTLHMHLAARLSAHEASTQRHFKSLQDALTTALSTQETATQTALATQRQAADAALQAAEKAVHKAEAASEKRFDSVNEFRQTLSDQQRTLMPRAETELLTRTIMEKIQALEASNIRMSGKGAGLQQGWLYLIGGASLISVVTTIALHFVK